MDKLIVTGGKKLTGRTKVSGAKNVALKAIVAACLTDEEVIIENVPLISDVYSMLEIVRELGGKTKISGHSISVKMSDFKKTKIDLEKGAEVRTSVLFLSPLLARKKKGIVPNPGGCRLGARPIDRLIDGLKKMNCDISYHSDDGYFYATTSGLKGTTYKFEKSTHTGTETLILAAVLANGKTVLENAGEEPEIDELISLLNKMGAKVKRVSSRKIEIDGVSKLRGTSFTIGPDRNEIVTFAIAALVTKGDVFIEDVKADQIREFIKKLKEAGAGVDVKEKGMRFFYKGLMRAVDVTTSPYPGFMTDWQALWAILMTQASGESVIHETVFENKLGYIYDLKKMGADAKLFNPEVKNPKELYNFNLSDDQPEFFHAVRITGPTRLHNAILPMQNIRAGAALVIAALAATGESVILEVHHLDRGYEKLDKRLSSLGAKIVRENEN